jgi:hypothetical protein
MRLKQLKLETKVLIKTLTGGGGLETQNGANPILPQSSWDTLSRDLTASFTSSSVKLVRLYR